MKHGIACAGNWIIDRVKFIDSWPQKGELCSILDEQRGPGGSPFNILCDFAHLEVPFPTWGLGCIGKDALGEEIKSIAKQKQIDIRFIKELEGQYSSYTDVMTIKDTAERTFFHCRGANAQFSPEHISIDSLVQEGVKIFHMGYLLLLDQMDAHDSEYKVVAARLFDDIQHAGIETSLDIVSEASERFKDIIPPCLAYLDHIIINEVEAGHITNHKLRKNNGQVCKDSIKKAALDLLDKGVKQSSTIHFPEGSVMACKNGKVYEQPSCVLEKHQIIGSVGAGDAFCAGALWGLHDGWDPIETLRFANGVAASSLMSANSVDGVVHHTKIKKLVEQTIK